MTLLNSLKTSKQIGKQGELLAKNYLTQQGLRYVDSNVHCRAGEIDLIFEEDETLVFVEVRYRENTAYGTSYETVNQHKQHKIIQAAKYYLQKNRLTDSVDCRFDVIGIEPKHKKANIHWFKNAFDGV